MSLLHIIGTAAAVAITFVVVWSCLKLGHALEAKLTHHTEDYR